MNLPNKISIFRIALVPLLVLTFHFFKEPLNYNLSLIVFIIGSISDIIDGYLARRDNLVTVFGKFVDPVADKLLVNTALVLLAVNGDIHVFAFLLMFWRDMIVDGVRMISATENEVIAASIFGKLKTILQMIAIIMLFLRNWPFNQLNIPMADLVLWLAVIASLFSGLDYLIKSKDVWFKSN